MELIWSRAPVALEPLEGCFWNVASNIVMVEACSGGGLVGEPFQEYAECGLSIDVALTVCVLTLKSLCSMKNSQ